MSGGLLEKAQQATGDSDADVGAAADAIIDTATTPGSSGGPPVMLYIAGGSLLLCMGLLTSCTSSQSITLDLSSS